jgi:hypothetical protein
MDWSEFQNDDSNSGEYTNPPDGESLFMKVIHDVLECLTGYRECIKWATTMKEDIPDNTLSWLLQWKEPTDTWIAEIVSLHKKYKDLPVDSLEWLNLIPKIGVILTNVPEVREGANALTLPSSEKSQQLITISIRFISTLNLIWNDIQAKEYRRLWTVQRYSKLIE